MTKVAILSAERAILAYRAVEAQMKDIASRAGARIGEQRKLEAMGMTSEWMDIFAASGSADAQIYAEDAWTRYLALAGVLTALAPAAEERILTADEHRARFRAVAVHAAAQTR